MSVLGDLLKREIELVLRFTALLEHEGRLLKQGDAESLEPLTTQKLGLVQEINQVESLRRKITGLNEQSNATDMLAWFENHNNEKEALQIWQKLLESARKARELHDLNAQLVSAHLQHATEALNVLLQRPADSGLYTKGGFTPMKTGSRLLDSA